MNGAWSDLWENEIPESGQEAIISDGAQIRFAAWVASVSPVWRLRDGGGHKHWTEFPFWIPRPQLPQPRERSS